MIYSPSQTKDWAFCPVYWWLKNKDHWAPRQIGKPEVAAIAGWAFAQAMAERHKSNPQEDPVELARFLIGMRVMNLKEQGFQFEETFQMEALQSLVADGVRKTLQYDPIPPPGRFLISSIP